MAKFDESCIIKERPELTPEERALPLAAYYDMPLHKLGPLHSQILRTPMEEKDALPIERWLEHLSMPGVYRDAVLGYRLMKDKDGNPYCFMSSYSVYPDATPEMMQWYFRWNNVYSKSQPKNQGNMRYKIWCPAGHWTHEYINGKDVSDGIMTQEQLDLLQWPGTPYANQFVSVRHPFDLRDCGVSEEYLNELRDAGIWIDPAYVKYFTTDGTWTPIDGTTIMLTMSRPCPSGGMEKYSAEYVGYGVEDGKPVYDPTTPSWKFTNEWMRMALTHGHTEALHLSEFLPKLYREYKDKEYDAD